MGDALSDTWAGRRTMWEIMKRPFRTHWKPAGVALVAAVAMALAACTSEPSMPEAGEPVVVSIPNGASGTAIAETLADAGVNDFDALLKAVIANPESTGIRPGTYRLATGMPAPEAVGLLVSGRTRESGGVLVVPGDRLDEIAAKVAAVVEAEPSEVLGVFSRARTSDGHPVEGYLGPATYDVPAGTTAQDLLEAMLEEGQVLAKQAGDIGSELGLSAHQVLTIASFLPAEVREEDYDRAAATILNRLRISMPLQLDSTAAYAAGVRQLELTRDQLDSDSPYNTYSRVGLPPGPIGQVSAEALEAVRAPADGDWLYWVTVNPDTGETRFSATYEEFLRDKAEYRTWLSAP